MRKIICKNESITQSILKAIEEIKNWPKWKQTFVAPENDNTFNDIGLKKCQKK